MTTRGFIAAAAVGGVGEHLKPHLSSNGVGLHQPASMLHRFDGLLLCRRETGILLH